MTEAGRHSAAVKRRQTLLLAGAVVLIVGAALLGTALTRAPAGVERTAKPLPTQILAPGAQVDPRDAWRGQADAQLKTIEQQSRELSDRNHELQSQNQEMMARLGKLEQARATTPSPAAALTASPPSLGPDLPSPHRAENSPQRLPPPPPALRQTASALSVSSLPPPPPPINAAPTGPAILRVTLADSGSASGAGGGGSSARGANHSTPADTRSYLASGAFSRAILLGGLDAPTGGQAQNNPQPVLLRLTDNAVLPNLFRARIKACFIVGAGYGDISSERAYIRTESLSCVTRDGKAIDLPVKGYVAGEDGKAGMRGRLVSKQGQILANALVAGVASGIGHAFQQSATTLSVSPLGATSTVDHGKQLDAGLGIGVGQALDRLAQYYISLAEKVFPVIEVDAGRAVDVVITQGVALPSPLDGGSDGPDPFPRLRDRTAPTRSDDDDIP